MRLAKLSCATGSLNIEGSSAFAPIIGNIAGEYTRLCHGAAITAQSTGSINGVRSLGMLALAGKDKLAVLSDGTDPQASADLVPQAVAVIVYSIVVNRTTGVEKLTSDQIKGIYQGRYRDWKDLRPGLSLPIRIVSRGQESGTRRTFEHNFLDGVTEPKLSLDTCMNPERDPQAPTTRCERSSTAAVFDRIAARPGAIGYADAPTAKVATAKSQSLTALLLDDRYPDITSVDAGYRFWTIEYLYTKGVPANDSVLKKFIDYLRSGTARAELQQAGYTPRIAKDGLLHPLCVHGVA